MVPVPCEKCNGVGEIPSGHLGMWGPVYRICPVCDGIGTTPEPGGAPLPGASQGGSTGAPQKREMSSQAKAAAMIRKHLRQQYPHTKFSVRSSSFAGGDSVDIAWTDGPTTDEVETFTKQFQYGSFDGMRDIYELTNTRDDIPQSKYVHCQRSDSREAYRAVVAMLNQRRGWALVVDEDAAYNCLASGEECAPYGYARDTIFRELQKCSCICPDCKAATLPGDVYCPACGNPQHVKCWMCDGMTEPRALTDHHGHRVCTSCFLTELEHKYA